MDESHPAENNDALTKAQTIRQALMTQQKSVMLATINADGSPLASYTPFVVDVDTCFYIFVSMLSYHTDNLLRTKQASLMLIADEATSPQIFARSRLTFACRAEELKRDSNRWHVAARYYEESFANMFKLLCGLRDFKMVKLVPHAGTLIVGFGQAYTLEGDALDQLVLRQD
ncbi:MAG: pyridoxamine 5'-phosphate oxidase family protein [Chloroflexota bacterium]